MRVYCERRSYGSRGKGEAELKVYKYIFNKSAIIIDLGNGEIGGIDVIKKPGGAATCDLLLRGTGGAGYLRHEIAADKVSDEEQAHHHDKPVPRQ